MSGINNVYPGTLLVEVFKSLSLNRLVHSEQVFVGIHSMGLVPGGQNVLGEGDYNQYQVLK